MIPMKMKPNPRGGTALKERRKIFEKKGTERQPRSPSLSDRKSLTMTTLQRAATGGKGEMHLDETGVQHGCA